MSKPRGGRGKLAPYQTKLVRIPIPLAFQVNQLVERYQDYIADGGESASPPQLLDTKPVNKINPSPDKVVSNFERTTELSLPPASSLLNRLRSLNPKSKATLKDVEVLRDLLASALESPTEVKNPLEK